jgi:hypothetical protein
MKTTYIILALTTLLLVACGGGASSFTTGCSEADFETASTLVVDGAVWQFVNAEQVAKSTSRASLAPLVRDMQASRDDLAAENWPVCASEVKSLYRNSMTATIDAYLAFMAEDRIVMEHLLHVAGDAWNEAGWLLVTLKPKEE